MKESQTEKLRLQVKNFGPIYKADIDLRPLTVFVGPSNTGKSYLATLIYALCQYFGQGLSGLGSYRAVAQRDHTKKMTGLGKAEKLALEQLKLSVLKNPGKKTITLPAVLVNGQVKDEHTLRTEICLSYGRAELSSFFRCGDKKNKPSIVLERTSQDSQAYRNEINLQEDKAKVKTSITEDMTMPLDASELAHFLGGRFLEDVSEDDLDWAFFKLINRTASRHLLPSLNCSVFYLPTGRAGNMCNHKMVLSALLTDASRSSVWPKHKMSGVVADFFKNLMQMDSREGLEARKKLQLNSVWKNIEATILEGEVNVDTESSLVNYPEFTYRPHGWSLQDDLPLTDAPASVSELASFVLFLKYLVQPGDVMIIEEPEARLYPDMQVEFLGQLAVLVNCGVKVLVTTHSEWMIEALDNIVKRSALTPEYKPRKPGKDAYTVALEPEDVGVWHFDRPKHIKGSIVKEIIADDCSGSYLTGFEEVTSNLHNEWASITSQIENQC